MFAVGLILDLLLASGFSNGDLYALDSFRIAFACPSICSPSGVIPQSRLRPRVKIASPSRNIVTIAKGLRLRPSFIRPDPRILRAVTLVSRSFTVVALIAWPPARGTA